MNNASIQSTIDSLRYFYTIVLALALSESFKQFVADKSPESDNPHIQWNRLPALLSFLFLIVPFYHGMLRYFFEAYNEVNRPSHYAIRLSFDYLAFTFEAFLFFALSRLLSERQWQRFYTTVLTLFAFDAAWVFIDRITGGQTILNWVYLDLIAGALLVAILWGFKRLKPQSTEGTRAAWLLVALIFLRTGADYYLNYSFYFPSSKPLQSQGRIVVKSTSTAANVKVHIYFAGPLFTQAEWQWNKRLAEELRKLSFDVLLPQDGAEPMMRGERPFDANSLFVLNTSGIDKADLVLAILDQADPDSGTCWECGYAYKIGRPIIGLRTDIRRTGDDPKASVNLMLSQSCKELIELPPGKIDDLPWTAQRISEAVNKILP